MILNNIVFCIQYPDDNGEDDCMTLVSKIWSKQEELNQSNSAKIIEKLSGKRLAFNRDGRGSRDPVEEEGAYPRSPSREKFSNKRLPATQVRNEGVLCVVSV